MARWALLCHRSARLQCRSCVPHFTIGAWSAQADPFVTFFITWLKSLSYHERLKGLTPLEAVKPVLYLGAWDRWS